MAEHLGDKTFDPTPHRRQQARQQGHVARSQDLCSAGVLLMGLATLMLLGGGLAGFLTEYCRRQLGGEAWLAADADFAVHHWTGVLLALGRHLLPILGLLLLAGVAVNVVQIGFMFLPQRLAWDPARVSPLQGLQRLFSPTNVVRIGFAIPKTVAVVAVAGVAIYAQRQAIVQLTGLTVPQLALQMTQILLGTAMKVGAALLALSLVDYAFHWWKHEQDLKMTPQELREEMRNLEGDPQVIARRKQVQRDQATNRLATLTPQTDVILTGPGDLAVAVGYDPDTMAAPMVLAKGSGATGRRIRELAQQRRITLVEEPMLAQSLHRNVALHCPVPGDQYAAVARVLTEIYR